MNVFGYVCPSCGGLYQDFSVDGMLKLLHKGLSSIFDPSPTPTTACIRSHHYVRYDPCGHCCPDVFGRCRACRLGYDGALAQPGHPSSTNCTTNLHYGREEAAANQLNPAGRYRATLHRAIMESFNADELETLCHHLDIECDNFLPGKESRTRELIRYCERTKRLPELINKCKELRPKTVWEWPS